MFTFEQSLKKALQGIMTGFLEIS